ncbi:MAG TPA: CNNM domain-containing protein, partial [Terrimesophilobacter sp.]|nr:CNNM domain-containing protein [Terrimesophilobacter sp.]
MAQRHRAAAGIVRTLTGLTFPGMLRPDELLERAGVHVPEDGPYETVGGFMMSELGTVPVVGNQVATPDGTFEVVRMDGRRIDRIRFTPAPAETEAGCLVTDWWGIAWLFLLLALNAFFVGAEFAVISARRSQIEPLAEAGNRRAKTTLYAMEHATLMLATSQLGITVCSLLILNVSEPAIHHLLEIPLALTGWPIEVIGTIAFIIALILVSYLHVVFGEMVPKNIAFSIPDRA